MAKVPVVGVCKLCLNQAELKRSHIVPKFLTSAVRDRTKGPIFQFDRQAQNVDLVQDTYRDRLLCSDCEQLLNDRYEKPFHEFWSSCAFLDGVIELEELEFSGFDYGIFKLLHLSILWRFLVSLAGIDPAVGSSPAVEAEAGRLRHHILRGDPGESRCNSITPTCLIDPSTRRIARGILVPTEMELIKGHQFATTLYDGFAWSVYLAPDSLPGFRRNSLKGHGAVRCRVKSVYSYPPALKIMQQLDPEVKSRTLNYMDRK